MRWFALSALEEDLRPPEAGGPALRLVEQPVQWAKVIDQSKCIGCHACTVACKSEHLVPLGVTRTYVKQVEVGTFPHTRRHFQVTRCNQCVDAPCVPICPVTAMYKRPDGIVDFDKDVCIGCKGCIAACPYDAIYIDPESHSAEKCNFCAHRIDLGLEPACVAVCPERAIIVGDLNDAESEVSEIVARQKVDVRKPEKGTLPKLFYVDANEYTLRPTAARLESMHMWSDQREQHPSHEPASLRQVAAILAYDVPHKAPWDWRVSAYTWTKSIAAGAYAVPALFGLFAGGLDAGWTVASTIVALVFLGLTGALLVGDLSHPERFLSILIRPQWKSWIARGAFIITAYGAVLGLTLLSALFGDGSLAAALRWPGVVLAALTAIYTAFLFAQARARDLWQNPVLPLHLLVQSALAGAAAMAVLAATRPLPGAWAGALVWTLGLAAAAHLSLVVSELLIPHMTQDASLAAWQLTRGRYAALFWLGLAVVGVAPIALVAVGGPAATAVSALAALAGLLLYEHAYVQAGQSVPLS